MQSDAAHMFVGILTTSTRPARRWPIARIGTNASRRVFAPRTSLLHLHLKADDSVTWQPTGIAHSVYQPIFDRFESHQISPRPSQNHCLPLFHVLPGEGGGGGHHFCYAVSRHCPVATGALLPISNTSFLVGLSSRGWVWGWAGAWRIARSANA